MVAGAWVAFVWWRESSLPIPARPRPSLIFRLVHREDRAAYVRIMRRTYAVAFRDMGRAMAQFSRAIRKELQPPLEAFAEGLRELFR
jgi:hypothetical protein